MRRGRHIPCLVAVALATAAGGCAAQDHAESLADGVDKARAAQTISSLQTALVTVSLVQAESAGAAPADLAAALQAKDPSNRYVTTVPTNTGVVQVVGDGGGPLLLVAMSDPGSEGRQSQYVGVWQAAGTTRYFAGTAPPTYTTIPPAGPGWGSTLPQ
jgi:hypothetical protein